MRKEAEIFSDLRELCTSPGYAHALATLHLRDALVGFADKLKPEDLLPAYSRERLIRNELAALSGLMISDVIKFSLPPAEKISDYLALSDSLMAELHEAMIGLDRGQLDQMIETDLVEPNLGSGDYIREAIFYGGDSAHAFQYQDMAAQRYSRDTPWLRNNVGFSIEEGRLIIDAIERIQSTKIYDQVRKIKDKPKSDWTLLPAFSFSVDEISKTCDVDEEHIRNFISAFSIEAEERNTNFQTLHDFNIYNARPLIPYGVGEYLSFQTYSLSEALYDSPFYWMHADKSYRPTAMSNRGSFTENFSYQRLAAVFGAQNTFVGVDIVHPNGDVVSEIDVLVVFGDRVLVSQTKSKKLTIASRKGQDSSIQNDFKLAIQDAYDQAYKCGVAILELESKGFSLRSKDRRAVKIPVEPSEIYLFCVVAEHYPALSFQARQFLRTQKSDKIFAPVVMDVFTLDMMTEFLSSPLHFLSYANKRALDDHRLVVSHEINVLGYHLKNNLWFEDQYSMVMMEDDVSIDISIAMAARRRGVPGDRMPVGILTRLSDTWIGRLIENIEARPQVATLDLGFFLLALSEETVLKISDGIELIVQQSERDGLHHDFTVPVSGLGAGVTIHCNSYSEEFARKHLVSHCEKRKYTSKANKWYGLCLRPGLGTVRFGVSSKEEWVYDSRLEAITKNLPEPSRFKNSRAIKFRKTGRNDICTCGSGLKYKKCCLVQ